MNYEELLLIETLDKFEETQKISVIGNLFDLSFDNANIGGIEKSFNLINQIAIDKLSDENYTTLQYDISNGWSYLRKLKYQNTQEDWNFQMTELTNEIFYLRKSIASKGFSKVPKERQCQIFTNLGNSFSYIGRFVEAQTYWDKAIEILPQFAMAIGNKGNGLFHYGLSLFDESHRDIFIIHSFNNLAKALSLRQYLDIGAEQGIQQLYNYLDTKIHNEYKNDLPNLNNYELGNDKELVEYRLWCIENKLFINPLNDLGNFSIASHDCLNLPTVIIEKNRPPVFLNLFNQIKQEYGTARFSYYNSIQGYNPHYSDTDIDLVETMETIRYSFYIEQLKISFRLSYSVLDKIAYLLNDYLKLDIEAHKISFRSLWYSNTSKSILRQYFQKCDNWALRGLYWLSKDLYEKGSEFDTVLEPASKEIATIRNFIEHKGFKVISDFKIFPSMYDDTNDISYTISRKNFEAKTLNLLKLTRAAIMYLSLAISHSEKNKDYANTKSLPIMSGIVPNYMKT